MAGATCTQPPSFALARGRGQLCAFASAEALADAVAERLRGFPHRVIRSAESDVRDGTAHPTLFVYGSDRLGNRIAGGGYVLGLGGDPARLRALLERADRRGVTS